MRLPLFITQKFIFELTSMLVESGTENEYNSLNLNLIISLIIEGDRKGAV